MIFVVRFLIFAAAGLLAAAAKYAGWYFLVPLGVGVGVGWLLSLLVAPHKRWGVIALALMGVQLLWALAASLVIRQGFETPVIGGILDTLGADLEIVEQGRFGLLLSALGDLVVLRNWDWSTVCLGVEVVVIMALAMALLRSESTWPSVVAILGLFISAALLFMWMRRGGFDSADGIVAALALRLTEAGLLIVGVMKSADYRAKQSLQIAESAD